MGELSMAKPERERERKSRVECLTQSMDVLGLKVVLTLLEQKEWEEEKAKKE